MIQNMEGTAGREKGTDQAPAALLSAAIDAPGT